MQRRSFLLGAGTLALSQLVSGCGNNNQARLNVRLLKNSIPAQLLSEFKKELKSSVTLNFAPETQLNQLFADLQSWKPQGKKDSGFSLPFIGKKTPAVADLITLGDYWLAAAIREKLIQPLEVESLSGWTQLPRRWQDLVRRNQKGELDQKGEIWGAPYRWGSTAIAYRKDKFEALGWTPKDWADLWHPDLKNRISVLDQPREVIGFILKKLGKSYNTTDLSKVGNLEAELRSLHQQVKFYSSDSYLQPLLLEDTWLAVGWSTDILPVIKRKQDLGAIIPQSGTALWTDLWVQPVQGSSSIIPQWIDFCWQPRAASEISLFSRAASPIVTQLERSELPKDIQTNSLLLPDSEILDKSEFLNPLPASTIEQYRALWQKVRNSPK